MPGGRDAGGDVFVLPFTAMGGACEIRLMAGGRAARQTARAAVAEVARIERLYSRYRPDSVTSRLNASAGGEAVEVDGETAALLDYADTCWRQSGGAFDITSGVLRRAWDFRRPAPPAPADVDRLLSRVGWDKVEWRRPFLRLPLPGMEIDFGGIGKEYAADRATARCLEHGAGHALVNLGGDVRAAGPRPDGSPWVIGIRHPRRPDGLVADVALLEGALATSGDYERFILADGRRYGHLLDPRTGWPPVNGLRAASVAAPLCIVAGSLASMAMLAGEDGGKRLLAESGLAHLWVDARGTVGGSLAGADHHDPFDPGET